jgi:hypothetical protein
MEKKEKVLIVDKTAGTGAALAGYSVPIGGCLGAMLGGAYIHESGYMGGAHGEEFNPFQKPFDRLGERITNMIVDWMFAQDEFYFDVLKAGYRHMWE